MTETEISTPGADQYLGPDRRFHRMFVTRNTEYHLCGTRCVAVRDRRSDTWLEGHLAVGRTLTGAVRLLDGGAAAAASTEPHVGDALYFASPSRQLVTSMLCTIERPSKQLVSTYPA